MKGSGEFDCRVTSPFGNHLVRVWTGQYSEAKRKCYSRTGNRTPAVQPDGTLCRHVAEVSISFGQPWHSSLCHCYMHPAGDSHKANSMYSVYFPGNVCTPLRSELHYLP
jgi:hypothetical protein